MSGGSESDPTFDFGSSNEESNHEDKVFGQEGNLALGTSSSGSDSEDAGNSDISSSGDKIWKIAPEYEAEAGCNDEAEEMANSQLDQIGEIVATQIDKTEETTDLQIVKKCTFWKSNEFVLFPYILQFIGKSYSCPPGIFENTILLSYYSS